MPRTPRSSTTITRGSRRRRNADRGSTGVVAQISQLVSANESLKLENANLQAENEQLCAQLLEIGAALGRLGGGRGRSRRGAEIPSLASPKPKRTRRPITDPEVLARRNAALAKARAARAEKLAAAKADGNGASSPS